MFTWIQGADMIGFSNLFSWMFLSDHLFWPTTTELSQANCNKCNHSKRTSCLHKHGRWLCRRLPLRTVALILDLLQTFYNAAFKKVQRITERYRKMEEVYAQVCTLFGENPRVVEPSEFFKTFIDFIANFKVWKYTWALWSRWAWCLKCRKSAHSLSRTVFKTTSLLLS